MNIVELLRIVIKVNKLKEISKIIFFNKIIIINFKVSYIPKIIYNGEDPYLVVIVVVDIVSL